MDIFIDNNLVETLSGSDLEQYALLFTEIEKNRADFNEKYELVYSHKYLKRT